jgi:hypothetical protein
MTSLAASSALGSPASQSARTQIESQYKKSCVAAGLKYINGMFSILSQDFRYVGGSAQTRPSEVRASIQDLFKNALSVTETKSIKKFELKNDSKAVCLIVDVMELTVPAALPKPPNVNIIEAVSIDEWKKEDGVWQLNASEQLKIVTLSHPAVPEAQPSPIPKSIK